MNIYILNTLATGLDAIEMLKGRIPIKGIIGLSQRERTDSISGYAYLKPYCRNNAFDFVEAQDYSLKSRDDRENLMSLSIDVLLAFGWQRLIPGWLIDQCRICAIGSHGSAYGISGGRGRSPQNWAILMGKKRFFISLFKIDTGTDSGDIISTRSFDLSIHDDIKTSYYKASLLTADMIAEFVKAPLFSLQNALKQSPEGKYLPQRMPEDGEIDWSRSAGEIYDFIRSLTRPYPGAFSIFNNNRITIWRSRPFSDERSVPHAHPGQIIKVFHEDDILIETGCGQLLLEDYILKHDIDLQEGMVLPSCDFEAQMRRIIERHQNKYPELILADDILLLARKNERGTPV